MRQWVARERDRPSNYPVAALVLISWGFLLGDGLSSDPNKHPTLAWIVLLGGFVSGLAVFIRGLHVRRSQQSSDAQSCDSKLREKRRSQLGVNGVRIRSRRIRILRFATIALALLTVAMWAASLFCWFGFETSRIGFSVGNGRALALTYTTPYRPTESYFVRKSFDPTPYLHLGTLRSWARRLGFERPRPMTWMGTHAIDIPLWIPFLCSIGLLAVLSSRHFCLRSIGACRHCGYNLTANTSGKCPECGTPISKPAQQLEPPAPPT